MDFSMKEVKEVLEEMGFRDIPPEHLELFAKDLKRLIRHERHVEKKKKPRADPPIPITTISDQAENDRILTNHKSDATNYQEKAKEKQERKHSDDAALRRLKTDPVKLYGWYKTFWELHGLNKK